MSLHWLHPEIAANATPTNPGTEVERGTFALLDELDAAESEVAELEEVIRKVRVMESMFRVEGSEDSVKCADAIHAALSG